MLLPQPVLGVGSKRQPQTEPAATCQQHPARVERRLGGERCRARRIAASDQLRSHQRPRRISVSFVS